MTKKKSINKVYVIVDSGGRISDYCKVLVDAVDYISEGDFYLLEVTKVFRLGWTQDKGMIDTLNEITYLRRRE